MSNKTQNERIIFGLKVKQLRQAKGLSFAELSERTQMSISYLNEIEKGKKFPKEDKIRILADVLGVSYAQITSTVLDKSLAPVSELLASNFLNELPLELFGIDLAKVVEIIANAPMRVGAFISTLLELSRNYAVKEEHFYFGALRSYLELNNNYFQDIEDAVDRFCRQYQVPVGRPLSVEVLERLLREHFGYDIVGDGLDAYPELQELRSVYVPSRRQMLLNSHLTPAQRAFQFGKELGFQFLGLTERAYTSSLLRIRAFDEVLNHARATYFSVALHMPLEPFIQDIRQFFARDKWDGDAFLGIMRRHEATPEMFFHRLTNVLPRFFGLPEIFFLRFIHDPGPDHFEIDKELHLSRRHHPHGNALSEHYCRRWVSVSLLRDLQHLQREGKYVDTMVGAQRSHYFGTDDDYFCLTLARPSYPAPGRNVSVTLGLLVNPELRAGIRFWDDPAIQSREVNTTCERCPIDDCAERSAPPTIVERRLHWRQVQQQLGELME